MTSYESFALWRSDQSPANQELIIELSALVEQVAPYLTTSVKWGQGCWLNDGTPAVFIHAEPDHVQLGFYYGATLDDRRGLLEGKGKYVRHVKVRAREPLDHEAVSVLIAQATTPRH